MMDEESGVSRPIRTNIGTLYSFYIGPEIEGSEKYTEWFDILRNSSENDEIKMHINCYGGDLFTTIQLLRCMEEAQGHITASIEGACMSAATLLFLAADAYEITENSAIMFHNYSSGTYGKGNEMFAYVEFSKPWVEKLFHSRYKKFLSDDEITRILKGEDIWMDSEEVLLRCQIMVEELQKEHDVKLC